MNKLYVLKDLVTGKILGKVYVNSFEAAKEYYSIVHPEVSRRALIYVVEEV